MLLSVITGTYNRLGYLKNMMASVKKSLPTSFEPGVDYEWCICDGGSTDGTLEWLDAQKGVRLVRHGELRGAIAAFNDAAKAATGDYLLQVNDDVLLDGSAASIALAYVMDNPKVGCATFAHDRASGDYHLEGIPVYGKGEGDPLTRPYMQAGVIPRWLWEHCGGWGDGNWGSKTYGGDCYISMRVYEAGYDIVSPKGCTMRDLTVDDDLRKKNYAAERSTTGKGFWKTYPYIEFGVNPLKDEPPLIMRKRILYAPIIEAGHDVQKEQKRGLRDALKSMGAVWEVDYVYSKESVAEAAEAWKPHMTVTQFHDENAQSRMDIGRIKRATQDHLINFCGDVWADQQLTPAFMDMLRLYDCHLVVNASLLPKYEAVGIKAAYWQNSSEPQVPGSEVGPECDVVFLGNMYNPTGENPCYRERLARELKSLPCKVSIYGRGYPEGLADGESLYDYAKTGVLYRGAKLIIADNQYIEAEGFASDRLFMALASGGGMLLHQKVEGMEKHMGLKDGVHYVEWTDLNHLKTLVEHYLLNDERRAEIAAQGTKEFFERHTYLDRVEELRKLISSIQPKRNTVSGMMIVKNEAANIQQRMEELASFVDDMVIVDTGSSDKTVELIKAFKGRVSPRLYHYAWNRDFSAARNYAKSKCIGDWIFWLDGDDEIPAETLEALKLFPTWKAHETRSPGAIMLRCKGREMSTMQFRLFKNAKNAEWRGKYHESLKPSLEELGVSAIGYPHLVIQHTGEPHTERDIAALSREEDSWMKSYYIASAHAAAGEFDSALVHALRSLKQKPPDESLDFIKFCCGLFSMNTVLNDMADGFLGDSNYPDAIYLKSLLTEDKEERMELLKKFLASDMPTETPSRHFEYKPEARRKLSEFYLEKAKEYSA